MSDVLTNVGQFFGKTAPVIGGLTAGSGLVGNILNSITRGRAVSQLEGAEKKFANLTPEQLSGLVRRAEQPLDRGLIEGVTNTVQADLATRGLSQAPGVFAAEESQALAPFQQAETQRALQLVLTQLGLPIEYAKAILANTKGSSDVSELLMMLLLGRGGTTPGGGGGGAGRAGGVPSGPSPWDDPAFVARVLGLSSPSASPGLTTPSVSSDVLELGNP